MCRYKHLAKTRGRSVLKSIQSRVAYSVVGLCNTSAVRRLLRREDGVAAVEFALVSVPFFALTFAIMETALVFFAGQYLETVTADSSRLILTGQAQTQGLSQSQFVNQICGKIVALFSCSNLIVDVQTYAGFSNANTSLPLSNGQLTFPSNAQGQPQTSFQPGTAGDIVVARVMYEWPVWVWFPGLSSLSNMSNKKRLLMATATFRNEPYQ
jgi:Flp pilus assembly protein TadG